MTGEVYTRQKFGPVPTHINEIIDELMTEGLIQAWSAPYFDFEVKRFIAHQPPDMVDFGSDELGFVDWWIKHIAEDHTAISISELSHDYGWKIAGTGEVLPYHAFLAKRIRQPNEGEELDWARTAASELGSR